jgi:Protein of unknown function (DUF2911)
MKVNKFAVLAAFALAPTLFSGGAVLAEEADQATKLTFSEPVEIPGMALQAGTYLFKADPNNLNIVRVFNADDTHLYTTLETNPTQRTAPTKDAVVTLAEQRNGTPEALVNWFYPGRTVGHKFLYSGHEAQELAQDRQRTIQAGPTSGSGN